MEVNLPLVLLLPLLFSGSTYGMDRNSALCFLTHQLKIETLQFARQMADELFKYHIETFIMVDDNHFNLTNPDTSNHLHLLQIPNELSIQYHYEKAIFIDHGPLTSWDKALFYFNKLHPNYSFLWLCEDDVFIPSAQVFLSMHELYSDTADLVVPGMNWNLIGDPSYWNWHAALGQFVPPWAHSMVNIIGFSRRMLVAIDDYVQWLDRVPFHEFAFHNIAIQLNYRIVTPTEFNTILYGTYFSYEQFLLQPNNIFHPVKDLRTQFKWRENLIKDNIINNASINFTDIETLCSSHRTTTELVQYLKDLLKNFVIGKSRFSATDRRLLRDRFVKVMKECEKSNASAEIVSLTMQLADHAMKLPELIVTNLIKNKSSYHLQLERELKENKKLILQLTQNGSDVKELRRLAEVFIRNLTTEIQREYKIQRELDKQRNVTSPTKVFSITTIYMIVSNESVSYHTIDINFLPTRHYSGYDNKFMVLTISVLFSIFFLLRLSKRIKVIKETINV